MTENQENKQLDIAGRFSKTELVNESASIEESSEFSDTQLLHELQVNCEKVLLRLNQGVMSLNSWYMSCKITR